MAYTSSTTYLFTRLHKTFSSCEPKEEWPHAGLYNHNRRQIVTNSMGAPLFSHFRVTNVQLINEKVPLILKFQNDMDCVIVFFYI